MPSLWRPREEAPTMEKVQRLEAEVVHSGVVASRCVRVGNDAARVTVGRQTAAAQPQVEVIRDGDVIQAIDVICACGQRIRVRCQY